MITILSTIFSCSRYQQVEKDLDPSLAFFGDYRLTDPLLDTNINIGEGLLSPTRTYVPILFPLLQNDHHIHMIFHNTGGGQTKCLRFGKNIHYIKNNLLNVPPIFKVIQKSSQTSWKEMYHVFNMGHRLEIVCSEQYAKDVVLPHIEKFHLDGQIIGHIEKSTIAGSNQLTLSSNMRNFQLIWHDAHNHVIPFN